jgi:hypothetical protein
VPLIDLPEGPPAPPKVCETTTPLRISSGGRPDLDTLAEEIKADLKAGDAAARERLRRYRAAGKALLKAKEECARRGSPYYRKWLMWLGETVGLSKTQAYRYMEWAKVPVTGTLEEQEAEWQRISGNAPPEVPEREEEPEPQEEPEPEEVPGGRGPCGPPIPRPSDDHTRPYHINLKRRDYARFEEMVMYTALREMLSSDVSVVNCHTRQVEGWPGSKSAPFGYHLRTVSGLAQVASCALRADPTGCGCLYFTRPGMRHL